MSVLRLRGSSHLAIMKKIGEHNRAYWCGWHDGHYGEPGCFTENHRLAEWDVPSDRLDYYRGHRAGRESRLHSGALLKVS